jgi:hypothetical protein
MALEILNGAFVFFGSGAATERAKVSPLAGSRIDFARVQPVRPGFQLSDHPDLYCQGATVI